VFTKGCRATTHSYATLQPTDSGRSMFRVRRIEMRSRQVLGESDYFLWIFCDYQSD